MSLYERIDRDVSPKQRKTFEFLLVYGFCLVAMLFPATIQRFCRLIGIDKSESRRSIFGEARTMATNCAAMAFMGM